MISKTKNNTPYYIGGIVSALIIGSILWQLRSILPTTDLMFWTGAVLSLAIPFGLWYIFQKYYNWCKDPIKDQLRQEIEQKHATVITKKYDSMPWLDKQKVKNA